MGHDGKLSFGEFLSDIRLVVTSPARRMAVIKERGASWGSVALLLVPTYFAFNFVGGIYFARDPFPGYSFIPPLFAAVATVFLKLYLIHVSARMFQGRRQAGVTPGAFSDLTVVFGYTGVPAILAILLGSAVFLMIPQEIGYLMRDLRVVGVSIMVGLLIALFIWNLILVVLALRTIYPMRDIKIVAAFILGSVLMFVPAIGFYRIVAQPYLDLVYVKPILSSRMLRFFASDPTSNISSKSKFSIHVDRLAYRLRAPERFELVAFLYEPKQPQDNQRGGELVVGSHSGLMWDTRNYALGRIVGLPGDTVELARGTLYVNGQAWDERYLTPEYRGDASLPPKSLGESEYLILPENRRLIDEMKDELVVGRDRIGGREILNRWPLGWWTFQPTVFLRAQPAAQTKTP
ncbi:MAG: S26 family signal peptidase [Acidobacteriia bacterium]|nr:S26 family signal peptidase [Terriglobia bacterium]